MKKTIKSAFILSLVILSGCAGPRISGHAIPTKIISENPEILSINDEKTREGFQAAVEKWLSKNGKKYSVKPDYSKHEPDKITLEYEGKWSWDLALYLREAEIEAFYNGQRVSSVSFRAPNSLNTNKWGNAEERINLMLDVLFGNLSAVEATQSL
jgi:hypothetical protein